MSKVKECEIKKFDLNSLETKGDIVRLSIKIEDAIKKVIGKENYNLTFDDARMLSIVALKFNSKKINCSGGNVNE